MKFTAFHEEQFRRQVDQALNQVETILDVTRTPTYAEDQDHSYNDKYALAEFLTNTAVAAQMNVLEHMGLDEEKLHKLSDIVHQEKRSVTLRFAALESCSFLKEQVVKVPSHEHEYQVETSKQTFGLFGSSKNVEETMKAKVSRSITEYHWKVSHSYTLFVFAGNHPEKDPIVLQTRTGSTVIVTSGNKKSPIPERTVHPPVDIALTWLIQQISFDKKLSCCFKIDRSKDTCRTPYRNEDIEEAMKFFETFKGWIETGSGHLERRVEGFILGKHSPAGGGGTTTKRLHSINTENIFCPILPLMETPREGAGTATREEQSKSMLSVRSSVQDQTSSPLLSIGDIDKFLNEQIRSLEEACDDVEQSFPSTDASNLITVDEASLYVHWKHAHSLCVGYAHSVGYIEEMLRKQLIAAIGKEVQPKDFDQFMQFHLNKLFHDAFTPKPFCYAIRRPDHYPDGVVSIEKADHAGGDKFEPVDTFVHAIPGDTSPPMYFPINAATSVEFTGPRFLHGWIQHRFSASSTRDSLRRAMLTARARQFSSFLLMIGTVAGPDKFNPKDAIIVQNKDEVIIPLLLNELPTAKEFKDAIASLSPEQQRFARSFRGMQLESSVFGVCVVQLKPQLEALLRLPQDALTKEIQLTQDLLSLFIKYQIPSDLLSYDGPEDAASADKLAVVKGHVKAVQDVIDKAKKTELEEAMGKAEMSVARYVAEAVDEERTQPFQPVGSAGPKGSAGPLAAKASSAMPLGGMKLSAGPPPPRSSSRRGRPTIAGSPPTGPSPPRRSSATPTMRSAHIVKQQNNDRISELSDQASRLKGLKIDIGNEVREQNSLLDDMGESFGKSGSANGRAPVPAGTHEPQAFSPQEAITGDLSEGESRADESIDFTMIPKELDALFEKQDTDSALRSTIIEAGSSWTRTRQEKILTKAAKASLNSDDVKSEKNKAFDLLDALSRSGSLPIACAELHVIVAITHTFEQDIMGTVIQDNINPIEKVEKTYIMMASKIHAGTRAAHLIRGPSQTARLASSFPALFDSTSDEEEEEHTTI
jgi:hypothetical protein